MAKTGSSRSARLEPNTTSSSTRRAKTLSESLLAGELDDAPATDIRRYTLDELQAMHDRGETFPTRADAEEIELDDEFWENAFIVRPGETMDRVSVHLRLSPEVYDWFKAQGKGHVTRMQEVLRAYYLAHKGDSKRRPKKASLARKG